MITCLISPLFFSFLSFPFLSFPFLSFPSLNKIPPFQEHKNGRNGLLSCLPPSFSRFTMLVEQHQHHQHHQHPHIYISTTNPPFVICSPDPPIFSVKQVEWCPSFVLSEGLFLFHEPFSSSCSSSCFCFSLLLFFFSLSLSLSISFPYFSCLFFFSFLNFTDNRSPMLCVISSYGRLQVC